MIPLCAHCGSGGMSEVHKRVVIMVTLVVVMVADALSSVLCTISLVLLKGLLS